MSKTRIVLRIVLVGMVIGLLVLGYVIWHKGSPEYYWDQAQDELEAAEKAVEESDAEGAAYHYEAARMHLQNLVRLHPTHDEGLELLSRVLLREGRAKGRPPTFFANPASVHFLAKAAELRPNDLDLQRRLLRAYLQLPGKMGKAAEVAKIVYADDPNDGNAHFALLWQAVETKNNARAEELFKKLEDPSFATRQPFQSFALKAKHYWDQDDEEKSDQAMLEASNLAAAMTAEQLDILTERDRRAMLTLLLAYQERAEEPAAALARAERVLEACRKLQDTNLVDTRAVATAGAQAVALFNMKFPPIRLEQTHRSLQAELAAQAQQLGAEALENAEEAPAPMLVYWNTARSHMANGRFDEGLAVLEDGFAAAEKLGDAIGEQHLDLHLLAARIHIMKRDFNAADEHLDMLLGQEKFAGWSHLLKGSVALHEGRLETADRHFNAASKALGNTVLVQMSMAHTYMAREQWEKAIPLLENLLEQEDSLDREQMAWYVQLLGSGDRIQFDLLRARLALNKWKDAQQHLQQLKGTEYESNAWALAVSYLWEEAKDEARATRLLQLARDKFPADVPLALLQARLLKEKGENAQAGKVLQDFASAKADDPKRQLAYARWLIRNRAPQKALALLDALEQQPQLSEPARNTLGVYRVQALIAAGQIDRARVEADRLVENPATRTAGYLMKAALAFRDRDEESGKKYLELARQSNPRNPALARMIMKIRAAQKDYEGVLDAGADVMDVSRYAAQSTAEVRQALRNLARQQGTEKALEKVDELLKKRQDDLTLRVLKVEFLEQLGRPQEAMRELDLAQLQGPDDPNIPRLKAQVWLSRGEFEAALQEAERSLRLEPKNADVMLLAARASLGLEKFDDALKYANTARVEAPENPQSYYLLADAFRKRGQPADMDKGVVALREYVRRRPEDLGFVMTLADYQNEAGRLDDALATLRSARRTRGGNMQLLLKELAMLLDEKNNRHSEAQTVARDALAVSKNIPQILAVAQTFASAGHNDDARQWAEKALGLANAAERPQVHSFLGNIYLRQGRPSRDQQGDPAALIKAREHFEAVLEAEGQARNMIAGNNLAWLLAAHFDRADDAVRVIEQVRNGKPVNQLPAAFIDTMALCYLKAGRHTEASQFLKQAVAEYPREANLLRLYGECLADEGQTVRAREMLETALEIGLPEEDEAEAKRKLREL